MRILAAIVGIVLGLPLLLFFWVGTQTFVRAHERVLATAMTLDAAALLILSLGLIFMPTLQITQAILLELTVVALIIIYATMIA